MSLAWRCSGSGMLEPTFRQQSLRERAKISRMRLDTTLQIDLHER